MARMLGLEAGAGSGDRTRITSLEGYGSSQITGVLRQSMLGHSMNLTGTVRKHRVVLPRDYRTQNGPKSDANRDPALTYRSEGMRHGIC